MNGAVAVQESLPGILDQVAVVASRAEAESDQIIGTHRAVRVVVDLLVDEDIWEEKKAEGATDKYLVGEVRKTLRIEGSGLWWDHDVQEVTIVEKGGHHGQS